MSRYTKAEIKIITQAGHRLGRLEPTPELTEAFDDFLQGYEPVGTQARFWEMYVYFCRSMVTSECCSELIDETAEVVLSLHRLFHALDKYFHDRAINYIGRLDDEKEASEPISPVS